MHLSRVSGSLRLRPRAPERRGWMLRTRFSVDLTANVVGFADAVVRVVTRASNAQTNATSHRVARVTQATCAVAS